MDKRLPAEGRPWGGLKAEMMEFRKKDVSWRRGRHAAYVWYANEEIEEVAREAYGMFLAENGLGWRVFPSLVRMEEEVISMVLGLLRGEGAAGFLTSGGTESIFLAVKAARDWARAHRPAVRTPEILAPFSAHPAFDKAAHYLGLRVIRVATAPDFRADLEATARAVGPQTILLAGSAPAYSLGVVDPIEGLAELARERGLWFHVDACVGGILGPFVRRLGHPVPCFDFSLPGVNSISADLHKSGFTPKGASALLFRRPELKEWARFEFGGWPTGVYSTLTFTGTRPGGAIAAAWAVMNYLGEKGYLELAGTVMEARRRFESGLARIPGFHLLGRPDLWAVAFGAEGLDILRVGQSMKGRGWALSPVQTPPGLHLMITPVHARAIDEILTDLAESAEEARRSEGGLLSPQARY